ncbi:hypothetical protein BOTBODRAFT_120418 [Botryobasidium botryosum FD-172 SS1]|uniref:N-acetyl-D-glucosamine kinase n=1 Tax=Botryobasidium botryosum (strain FD-172 SS1) TaxID=930990 RepID=A0A067LVI1_BOTB1|nr:hypothetical protein BOTBODRAFT_120418 [Botryobasidium botryosum FD-172 SS1]
MSATTSARAHGGLFLCVDCGGSKTAAAIASPSGSIVARGLGGPSNFTDVAPAVFLRSLQDAVQSALHALPLDALPPHARLLPARSPQFAAVWVGASGVDTPAAVAALTRQIAPLFALSPDSPRVIVTNDTHLLASPLRLHPRASLALVTIAGTGSIVVSFAASPPPLGPPAIHRIGGWGWILGDEGSGFYIGRAGVQWLLGVSDSGHQLSEEERVLYDAILRHFDIVNPTDIFEVVYAPEPEHKADLEPPDKDGRQREKLAVALASIPRKHRLSTLTPLIFYHAFSAAPSNPYALSIARAAASSLASQMLSCYRLSNTSAQKHGIHVDGNSTILCFGGGLLGVREYREMVLQELKDMGEDQWAAVELVDAPCDSGAKAIAKTWSKDETF